MAGPRRRRGGDRAAALGGVAKEGAPARAKEGGGELRRDAWASRQEVARGGGSPRRAGGAALHSGSETEQRSWRKGEKDPNAISEISRDQTVK